jgi:hypothetical protein
MLSGRTVRGWAARTLAVFVVLSSSLAAQNEDQRPFLENRLAKEELLLAKTPTLYFIVYLKSKTVVLKSRGMNLQEWKIRSVHTWGDALPLSALSLEKKSTLPKRTKIQPAAPEEDPTKFELDALELKDMPSRFTLFLSGGIRVQVRPKAKGFFPRLGNFGHFIAWNVWMPLKNLSHRMKKRPFSAIDLKLEKKEDGQAIFWAFPDGIKGLVFPL